MPVRPRRCRNASLKTGTVIVHAHSLAIDQAMTAFRSAFELPWTSSGSGLAPVRGRCGVIRRTPAALRARPSADSRRWLDLVNPVFRAAPGGPSGGDGRPGLDEACGQQHARVKASLKRSL